MPPKSSPLADVPTPAVVVCETRFLDNIDRMQARARTEKVGLRPHVKTHKSIALAQRQLSAGATGLTVAKVGEAEVFADGGFRDLRIAYPLVQQQQFERVARLIKRGVSTSFLVESKQAAQAASDYFEQLDQRAQVLLKIDCGYGRVGIRYDSDKIVDFAAWLDGLRGLRLAGLLTHAGQSYHGPEEGESPAEALVRVSLQERNRTLRVAEQVDARRREGTTSDDHETQPLEVSIGSTPSMSAFKNVEAGHPIRITEIRPGNYAFNDMTQVALGAATADQCALTVLTTVVSVQEDEVGLRYILDAGRKVLTSDIRFGSDGYGQPLRGLSGRDVWPGARLPEISEEHTQLRAPEANLGVGDRVRIIPNHACVVVNTQESLLLEQEDGHISSIQVDARGRVV